MDSKVFKARLMAAFFAGVTVVSLAWAGVTNLDSLQLEDGTILDSGGTTRITLATSTPHVKLAGTEIEVEGFLWIDKTVSTSTVGTATRVGQLARSDVNEYELYIATTASSDDLNWAKVGGQ